MDREAAIEFLVTAYGGAWNRRILQKGDPGRRSRDAMREALEELSAAGFAIVPAMQPGDAIPIEDVAGALHDWRHVGDLSDKQVATIEAVLSAAVAAGRDVARRDVSVMNPEAVRGMVEEMLQPRVPHLLYAERGGVTFSESQVVNFGVHVLTATFDPDAAIEDAQMRRKAMYDAMRGGRGYLMQEATAEGVAERYAAPEEVEMASAAPGGRAEIARQIVRDEMERGARWIEKARAAGGLEMASPYDILKVVEDALRGPTWTTEADAAASEPGREPGRKED